MSPEESNRAWYASRIDLHRTLAFDDIRQSCPWCGSHKIVTHLRTTDLLQRKPGSFHLDRCLHCAHIFQNPRLSAEGLEYYYRDCYDGINLKRMQKSMRRKQGTFRRRARAVLPHMTRCTTWLDVGAAHGQFCDAARKFFPGTVFHGLDASGSLADAVTQGWVDYAFQMELPALLDCPWRTTRYDVISMFHVLEHTTDPRAHIECAAGLIEPGGLLIIELPNPSCPMARLLGRYWFPWLQPQHLHMAPCANVVRLVEELGWDVLVADEGTAHDAGDLIGAMALAINRYLPVGDVPWRATAPIRWIRWARRAGWMAALLPLLVGLVLDKGIVGPLLRSIKRGNAFQIIARRPP